MKKFKFLPFLAVGIMTLTSCAAPEINRETAKLRLKEIDTAYETNQVVYQDEFSYIGTVKQESIDNIHKKNETTQSLFEAGYSLEQKTIYTTTETIVVKDGKSSKLSMLNAKYIQKEGSDYYLYDISSVVTDDKESIKLYSKVKKTESNVEEDVKTEILLILKETIDSQYKDSKHYIEESLEKTDNEYIADYKKAIGDSDALIKFIGRYGSNGKGSLEYNQKVDVKGKYASKDETNGKKADFEGNLEITYVIDDYKATKTESRVYESIKLGNEVDKTMSMYSLMELGNFNFRKPDLEKEGYVAK